MEKTNHEMLTDYYDRLRIKLMLRGFLANGPSPHLANSPALKLNKHDPKSIAELDEYLVMKLKQSE